MGTKSNFVTSEENLDAENAEDQDKLGCRPTFSFQRELLITKGEKSDNKQNLHVPRVNSERMLKLNCNCRL
jgi:hypothetical protein